MTAAANCAPCTGGENFKGRSLGQANQIKTDDYSEFLNILSHKQLLELLRIKMEDREETGTVNGWEEKSGGNWQTL